MHRILKVPEIQEMIFRHLDAQSRREVGLESLCKSFYRTICHLGRNNCLTLTRHEIDDDKTFDSIMDSSRRFGEIDVKVRYNPRMNAADRTVAIVLKFKPKQLTISAFPESCQAEMYTALLNLAEDSLEGVTIRGGTLSQELLQAFVDRQRKLKKVDVPGSLNLFLDHLALEEMFIYDNRDDGELAALLRQQPALRRLRCNNVGSIAFNELRQMKDLKVLNANISKEVTGELCNLQELMLRGNGSVFRRVILPRLEKLVTTNSATLEADHFAALSRSSRNLQHIEMRASEINFLPAIIDRFPALKTLFVKNYEDDDEFDDDYFDPVLSRNQNLEELVINVSMKIPIGFFFYHSINACPNIKHISLDGLILTENEVLGLIESHPHLAQFTFVDPTFELFGKHLHRVDDRADKKYLDPKLVSIVKAFRSSATFKHLTLIDIAHDVVYQPVEDLFEEDADKINFLKDTWQLGAETCTLTFDKKSNARDLLKNFHSKFIEY